MARVHTFKKVALVVFHRECTASVETGTGWGCSAKHASWECSFNKVGVSSWEVTSPRSWDQNPTKCKGWKMVYW